MTSKPITSNRKTDDGRQKTGLRLFRSPFSVLRSPQGFTLIELIITASVAAIGFVAILLALSSASNLAGRSKNIQIASQFTQFEIDLLRSVGYSGLGNGSTDVTGNLISNLPGTTGTCASITAKSACLTTTVTSTIGTVNDANDTGWAPSLAMGTDGLPIVVSASATSVSLIATKCVNPDCSTTVQTTVDPSVYSPNGNAHAQSVTIGTDGLPVISYLGSDTRVHVAKCGNPACSSGNTLTNLSSPSTFGAGATSIATSSDGFPVIATYSAGTGNTVNVIKCANAACSSTYTLTNIDAVAPGGSGGPAIAVPSDGLPVLAYHDQGNDDLKFVKCGNTSCSSGNTTRTLDSINSTGYYPSIAIGSDGLPVISYLNNSSSSIYLLKCTDSTCSASGSVVVASSNATDSVVAIGADGFPVVAYRYSVGDGDLKFVKCKDLYCSTLTNTSVLDTASGVSYWPSMGIGPGGLPVIAYHDTGITGLKVYKCGSADCATDDEQAVVSVIVRWMEGTVMKVVTQTTTVSKNGLQ